MRGAEQNEQTTEGRTDTLADFITREADNIVALFSERVLARAPPTTRQTRSHIAHELPAFLNQTVQALRSRGEPRTGLHSGSTNGRDQGPRPARPSNDPAAITREYDLLRDCIFERLEHVGCAPTIRELRILTDHIFAAGSAAVHAFVHDERDRRDEERRRLLALFRQAPGFVAYLVGPEHRFELANDAYLHLVGRREIIGLPLREALPEVASQGFFDLLDRVRVSGEAFVGRGVEVSLQRSPDPAPSHRFVDFIYQPIVDSDGDVAGILVQGQDVTDHQRALHERQAAQELLAQSEERYRTVFESIDEGFCLIQLIFDAHDRPIDYRFLEANSAFERHTGLVNAVGRTARELVPDLDQCWFDLYGRIALSGEPARFENHAPAMDDRWFEVYALRVGPAEKRHVALVFKNVSDRKRAERAREELLRMESSARREAEKMSRMKDEFIAMVSHELRTPLHAMLGWTHMLRVGDLDEAMQRRALETVERNARAQAHLVDDLLDVSRIIQGQLHIASHVIALGDVIDAAIETVRPAAEAKQITLRPTLAASCSVRGDAQRLHQIAWNLLSNAVKFTPKGGAVTVLLHRVGDRVHFAVTDTGKGIDADFLPHVFERFRQADCGTARKYGGLGLGLSIVGDLVRLHGGEVHAFSRGEGQGATFTVELPLAGVVAQQVDDEVDAREPEHSGGAIERARSRP